MGYVPDSPLPHASWHARCSSRRAARRTRRNACQAPRRGPRSQGFDEEKFLADGTDGTCLPAAVADRYDDSGAKLDVGQTGTKNLKLLANLPKSGALAGEANFNSDLAFKGDLVFQGNYNGFQVTDVSDPENPQIVSQVLCPGSQNDISVWEDLLFLSTDSSRSDDSCQSTPLPATEKAAWEGIKVFDISDVRNPRYVAAVETKCGSHTHTLVPDGERALLYVSSYGPNATFPDCKPPHDLISIVEVPLNAPQDASLLREDVFSPMAATTAATATPGRPRAATTSPSTRRSTSPRAPAWARA